MQAARGTSQKIGGEPELKNLRNRSTNLPHLCPKATSASLMD